MLGSLGKKKRRGSERKIKDKDKIVPGIYRIGGNGRNGEGGKRNRGEHHENFLPFYLLFHLTHIDTQRLFLKIGDNEGIKKLSLDKCVQIGTNISRESIYFVLKRRTMTNRMYVLFKIGVNEIKKRRRRQQDL